MRRSPATTWATIYELNREALEMDAEIQENVEIALSALLPVALKVRVREGVVIIDGAVDSYPAADEAERLARQVEGVKQVVNNLVVELPRKPWPYATGGERSVSPSNREPS